MINRKITIEREGNTLLIREESKLHPAMRELVRLYRMSLKLERYAKAIGKTGEYTLQLNSWDLLHTIQAINNHSH